MQVNMKKMIQSALLLAMIFAVTYLIRIPVPGTQGGYINPGDSVIYIGALIPGGYFAIAASGIASAIADLVAGAAIYAPFTLVIKALMSLVCWLVVRKKRNFKHFAAGSILGGVIMVLGYALSELIVFGVPYMLLALGPNLIQLVGGVAIGMALYFPIKRLEGVLS